MPDLLERIRGEIAVRLGESEPLVGDFSQLRSAAGEAWSSKRPGRQRDRWLRRAWSAPPQAAADGHPAPRGKNNALIGQVLLDRDGASAKQVAEEAGIATKVVRSQLSTMARAGRVTKPTGAGESHASRVLSG